MSSPFPFLPVSAPRARRLALAAAAAVMVALASPRGAGTQPERRPPAEARHQAPPCGREAGLPDPFWLALLVTVLSGVAGAAAAARIAGPRGEKAAAGALEALVVGSASAVALLAVNPPGGAWRALAATAAAGGVAGEALLLASAHARRAVAAEHARDAAEEGARRTAVLAGEQLETLRRLAVDTCGVTGGAAAPADAWERALEVFAERARVELLRVARGPARRHAAHPPPHPLNRPAEGDGDDPRGEARGTDATQAVAGISPSAPEESGTPDR